MPLVPDFNEQQRIEVKSPAPVQDTNFARSQGEALSQFGRGVTALGLGLMEGEGNAARAQRAREVNAARQQATAIALEEYDRAIHDGKPDGSDYVQNFTKNYKNRINEIANSITDPATKYEANTAMLAEQNQMVSHLFEKARVERSKLGVETLQKSTDTSASIVRQNPSLFQSEYQRMSDTIDQSNDILPAYEREVLKKKVLGPDLAEAAVYGRMAGSNPDFRGARKDLETKYSQFLEPDKVQQIRDKIDNEEIRFKNQVYTESERQKKQAADEHSAIMDANTRVLSGMAWNAKTHEDRAAVAKNAQDIFVSGQIKESQLNFVQNIMKEKKTNIDDAGTFIELYDQILSKKAPADLHSQIVDMTNSDDLTASHAKMLLDAIVSEHKKAKHDPLYVEQNQAGLAFIKGEFAAGMFDIDRAKVQNQQGHAILKFQEYKEKGFNPKDAAIRAVRDLKGDAFTVPFRKEFPAYQQTTVEGIDGLLKNLQQKAADPKTTREEKFSIIGIARGLEEKKKALIRDQQFKPEPKVTPSAGQ